MQPYFAPYLGYLSLIKHTDLFILFDVVQFIRHGWIERNRILKQDQGWVYVQVPLEKFSRETLIKDVVINSTVDWKSKIFAQLTIYKKKAPYYSNVIQLLDRIFESEFTSIVELNKKFLQEVCQYLNITTKLEIFSEMNLDIEKVLAPDEWALHICKEIGENVTYINPIGGLEFFDRKKYVDAGINIFFQQMNLSAYNQKREVFEPGLSILDVLMFNSTDEANLMLDQFELI